MLLHHQALVQVHLLRYRLLLLLKKYQRLVRRLYQSLSPLRPAFGVHATACDSHPTPLNVVNYSVNADATDATDVVVGHKTHTAHSSDASDQPNVMHQLQAARRRTCSKERKYESHAKEVSQERECS